MKKLIIISLACIVCLMTTACGGKSNISSVQTTTVSLDSKTAEQTTAKPTEKPKELTTAQATEKATAKSTEPPTEPQITSKVNLETGLWVKYSPQAAIFDTYKFIDGVIEHKEYVYESGSIEEFNSDHTYSFMTYTVDENSVTIRDNNSKEWTYYFSSDEDTLERTYEEVMGGTDTFTVTEKMYHHESLPSYETVKEQSKKRG